MQTSISYEKKMFNGSTLLSNTIDTNIIISNIGISFRLSILTLTMLMEVDHSINCTTSSDNLQQVTTLMV
jgi:hypothetical protein